MAEGYEGTLPVYSTGLHEGGDQTERPVESAQSQLRDALTFLGPFLSDFKLTPSHAMGFMAVENRPEPTRRSAIINQERKRDNLAAVNEFIDWLLHSPKPRCMPDFFEALQHDTDEHRRVYCLLALCGVYLPVQQQLVTVLGKKLQEDYLILSRLLTHLTQHGLLSAEQKTNIVADFMEWLKTLPGTGTQEAAESLEKQQNCEEGLNEAELEGSEQTSARQVQVSQQTVQTGRAEDSEQRDHGEEASTQLERSQGGQDSAQSQQPLNMQDSQQRQHHDFEHTGCITRSATPERRCGSREATSVDSGQPHRAKDPESVMKYLLASLYYRQIDIFLSNPSASSASTPRCDRCSYEAGEGILGHADCLWTDHLVRVLNCPPVLPDVSGCMPDRETYRQLWSRVEELLSPFVVQPREVTPQHDATGDAAAGGQEVTDAPGSDAGESTGSVESDSDRTVVQKLCNLASVKNSRTEQYVKAQTKAVLAGLVDFDHDSIVSEHTMSSDNNPAPAPPVVPRTEGVLQKEEMTRLKTGVITLRPFQEELLAPARKGHNVMICVPTGTGKTYLVLKYAQEHLTACTGGRMAFVVPKVRLATQQHARFEFFLPQFKPHLRTGETSGTNNYRIPWPQLLEESRIFVLTAECLVKAVEQKRVCLSSFTLLVLDECHHTRGGHPLRNLMNQYMDLKFSKPAESVTLPQIIGLTASPGVGRARGESVEKALEYLLELCSRLDVREICSVREHKADLEQYVHEPQHEILVSDKRKKDRFKGQLETFMEYVEQHMYTHEDVERYIQMDPKERERLQRDLSPPVSHRGENQYTEWAHGLEKKLTDIKSKSAFYVLMSCTEMLKLLQRALILNDDCRSDDALNFLKKEIARRRTETPDTARVDHHLYDRFEKEMPVLEAHCRLTSSQNPKLMLLRKIILTCTSVQDPQMHSLDAEDISTGSLNIPAAQEPNSACSDWVSESVQLSGTGPHQPDGQLSDTAGIDLQEGAQCLSGSCGGDARYLNDGTREDPNTDADAGSDSSSDIEFEILDCGEDRVLDSSVRGMIFVRTLDLSKALVEFIRDDPKLCELNPARITGVNASVKDGGMTKSEVTEVMGNFNAGHHKIVVCTSAAEEGLDFTACNLVIRYDYVTSMVSMIQTRGRARQKDSLYCVMGNLTSTSIAKERANQASEKLMCAALTTLQQEMDGDPGAHLDRMARRQHQAYTKRWNPEVAEARRQSQKLPGGYYKLLCSKCRRPACQSTHIRLLKKTNRVVIGAAFSRRYTRQEAKGKTFDKDIPMTGHALHCGQCGQKWGIFVRSVADGAEFPVITVKSFLVQNEQGEIMKVEKWSKAFDVPHLSEEDRATHVDMSQPSVEEGDAEDVSVRDEHEGILGQAGEDGQQVPSAEQDLETSIHIAGFGEEDVLVLPAGEGSQQASSREADTKFVTTPKEVDRNVLFASGRKTTSPRTLAMSATVRDEKVLRQASKGKYESSSGNMERECLSTSSRLKTASPGTLSLNTSVRDGEVLRQASKSRQKSSPGKLERERPTTSSRLKTTSPGTLALNTGVRDGMVLRQAAEGRQQGEGERTFHSVSSRLKTPSSRTRGASAGVRDQKGLKQSEKTDSDRNKKESQKLSTSMKKKTTPNKSYHGSFDPFDDDLSYVDNFDLFDDGTGYEDLFDPFDIGPSCEDTYDPWDDLL